MDEQLLKGHLPLLILGLLAEKPMHGYALAQEAKARAVGVLRMGEGTLYPLLHRLEDQECIRGSWENSPAGKQRKIYTITPKGRRKIMEGKGNWSRLSVLIKQFMGEDWKAS